MLSAAARLRPDVAALVAKNALEGAFTTVCDSEDVTQTSCAVAACVQRGVAPLPAACSLTSVLRLCVLQQLSLDVDTLPQGVWLEWIDAFARALLKSRGEPDWSTVAEHVAGVAETAAGVVARAPPSKGKDDALLALGALQHRG